VVEDWEGVQAFPWERYVFELYSLSSRSGVASYSSVVSVNCCFLFSSCIKEHAGAEKDLFYCPDVVKSDFLNQVLSHLSIIPALSCLRQEGLRLKKQQNKTLLQRMIS
jgi:hypothetical protein